MKSHMSQLHAMVHSIPHTPKLKRFKVSPSEYHNYISPSATLQQRYAYNPKQKLTPKYSSCGSTSSSSSSSSSLSYSSSSSSSSSSLFSSSSLNDALAVDTGCDSEWYTTDELGHTEMQFLNVQDLCKFDDEEEEEEIAMMEDETDKEEDFPVVNFDMLQKDWNPPRHCSRMETNATPVSLGMQSLAGVFTSTPGSSLPSTSGSSLSYKASSFTSGPSNSLRSINSTAVSEIFSSRKPKMQASNCYTKGKSNFTQKGLSLGSPGLPTEVYTQQISTSNKDAHIQKDFNTENRQSSYPVRNLAHEILHSNILYSHTTSAQKHTKERSVPSTFQQLYRFVSTTFLTIDIVHKCAGLRVALA